MRRFAPTVPLRSWLLRSFGKLGFLFFLIGGAGIVAAAEETLAEPTDPTSISLEQLMIWQIVETPSRIPQTLAQAPSSVTVITSDEVKKYGYRTLADALTSARGVHQTYNRAYSFLGMRGFNRGDFNSRVLVLVDGHRINNSLTDGAAIGTDFILDVDLIDRIEVVRGPGSVLYGNNAFFGVINVVTRQGPHFNGQGFELSGEAGDLDTRKGRLSFGRHFTNGLDVVLSGTWFESDGVDRLFFEEFNNPANNFGVAEDLDRTELGSFFGSVRYAGFTLQGGYIDRRKDIPTAPEGIAFNDPRAMNEDGRSYVSLRYLDEIPGDITLMANVYYDRSDLSRDLPSQAGFLVEEAQFGEWWGAELQLTRKFWEQHTLTLGTEYRDDFNQESRLESSDLPPGVMLAPPHHETRKSYGVYVHGDFTLQTNLLHLNAGVRYDQYEELDPAINPRLALIYTPLPKSVFKAIYGTAFRAPNFRELIDERFQNIGAEEITSYELVYEQGIGRNLRSTLSGFYNRIDDLIVFQNGAYGNENTDAIGMEMGLEGSWASGMRARLSYTLQKVTDRETDSLLTDAPRHLAKFNLIVPLWEEKLFGAVEFEYTGRRQTARTSNIGGLTVPGEDVPDFGVMTVTLFAQKIVPGFEFSASVYNVFDNHYFDPSTPGHIQSAIPQDGRTFRVKLTYSF